MSWFLYLLEPLWRKRARRVAEIAWDDGYNEALKTFRRSMPLPWRYAKYEIFHVHDNINGGFLWRLAAYDGNYHTVADSYEPATHDMALFDLIDRNINLFRPEDKPAAPREAK